MQKERPDPIPLYGQRVTGPCWRGSHHYQSPGGREFVLAEVEDFEDEIVRTRQNAELMALLDERSRETVTYTLEQVRERLKLKQTQSAEG